MAYYIFNFTRKGADKSKPLREQAGRLLKAKLWGIGNKTQNRELLAAGDRVLAYVGAPEQAFIGHATLSSGTRTWTPQEAQAYPEDWPAGVAFEQATLWEHPVPLKTVWPEMPSAATNPDARFFGGVVRVKQEDFERVLAERESTASVVTPASSVADTSAQTKAAPDTVLDRLYLETERLRAFVKDPKPLSEDATRALLINRYIDALGYTDFGDVDYGVPVESGDFADYVLQPSTGHAVVIEAKKFGAPLGPKEAAQVVKYASVLGLRWGLVTDGRYVKLYDAPVPNVTPANRLVFELDLAGYGDREDFEVSVYPDLSLLSKSAIENGAPLEERAAQEGIRELLTTPDSATLSALRKELQAKKLTHLGDQQLVDLLSELLG